MKEEKLPKGWKLLPLKDLNQRKSKNIDPSKHPEITFELYSVPQFEFSKPEYLKGREIKSTKQKVSAGEVLISKINPRINRVWKVEGFSDYEKIASSEWIIIKPKSFVDSDYLRYACSAPFFRTLLQSEVSGVGGSLTRARPKIVENYKLPIAPLPEQQRIVAKLDALFGHLDSLREKLDGIPTLLKNFRQQVLTQAVTGELTKEWREGKGLGEWEEKSTNDLFEFVTSGSRGWAEYYNPSGNQLFVRITNMNFGRIDLDLRPEKCQYLELPERQEGKRTLIKPRDILISITADVGMIALIEEDFGIEAYVNQHICLARPGIDINEKFLAYYLMSDEGFGQFQSKKRGATKAGLTLGDIRALNIKLPTAEEQAKIVEVINTYLNLADRIESQYTSLKAKIDQLPQAILAKAFRGKLVSQEVKEYVVEESEGLMAAEGSAGYKRNLSR